MEKKIDHFLRFYKNNEDKLIYEDGIRPSKSLTRNIFNNVEKFTKWYNETKETTLTLDVIINDICQLTDTGYSTIADNIRGMIELQFLTEVDNNIFKLTRNFIDYLYSKKTLDEHIIEQMGKIDSVENITMLQNYILATLREGIIKGNITCYPDGVDDFIRSVPDKNERVRICKEVYSLYGFKGRNNNPENGDYTPNINYRIISTCVQLGIIKRLPDHDTYGFKLYTVTKKGIELLQKIDNNIANYDPILVSSPENVEPENQSLRKSVMIDDIYDELYIAETNNTKPDAILNTLDLPEPLANKYTTKILNRKRDAKKAANAKLKANYLCEFDNAHLTFVARTNNKNYVEAHHLIPVQLQSRFWYNLDVEANIEAICPVCHRRIHHGTNDEKREVITKLYNERINRLKQCNIYIELKDLLEFYFNN